MIYFGDNIEDNYPYTFIGENADDTLHIHGSSEIYLTTNYRNWPLDIDSDSSGSEE